MIAQISNGKLTAKSSTRLTEVYWEIQPADDSDYWPLADETGTEYILFTSRDGSIGYYKEEEGSNTYSKHALGIQGSITSMIAIPIRIKSYKGTAFICVKSADESQQFYRINIANGELKYIALEQREGFKPVRVAGGMCMATGQALAWFLYDVIGNPKPSMEMDAWLLKAGEEKQIRFQDDPKDFDSNPIGPIAISDNYMVPVLFCPHTNYFQDRKGFRITVIKNGHYGYGAWPISDDMYPSTLIQAAHVNFTALECYNLLLLEQKIRSLWISKCEAYQPRKYYPLITSDEMELKSFAVQAIRRNNRDILSITGTAYNHPGKIYHSFCDPQNEKNLNMIPIADNVLTYHDCVNAQHEHLIYYTSKNKDTKILELHRLSYDSLDDEWQDELVAGNNGQAYRSVPVYEHRLHVTDSSGLPVADAEVTISTDTRMHLESGGQFIPIDQEHPKKLRTDMTGTLAVFHETHSLSGGDIHMELSFDGVNTVLVSSPAEMQRQRFAELERTRLQNAKDSNGNYILPPKRRQDTQTLDNICKSIKDIAGKKSKDHCFASGCNAFCLEKQENGSVMRTELTIEEFEALRQDMLHDSGSFWSSLADFFRSVAKGIVKVVKTIVQVIGKAIQTVVEFVIDGVRKVIDFVVDTVHHIVNTIESVLGFILESFEPLFSWIGELIGVNSIIRTQNAVKFLFEESIVLVKNHAEKGVRFLKDNVSKVSSELDKAIDDVCKSLGTATPAVYQTQTAKYVSPYADMTDNYVTDLVKRQLMDGITVSEDFYLPLRNVADDLLAYLQTVADKVQNEPNFQEAEQYLLSITKNQGEFLNYSIAALLKGLSGVLKVMLSMLTDLCEGMINLGLRCLDAFSAIVNQKIQIPVLGTLFKMVFRQDLTLLNLASLLISMPAHVVMKIAKDQVPFENDQALTTFKNECKRGLKQTDGGAFAISEKTQNTLSLLSGVCQTEVYFFVGISDATYKLTANTQDNRIDVSWNTLSIIGNMCWLVCDCPVFSNDEPSVVGYGTWFVCLFNLIIDFGTMCCSSPKGNRVLDSVTSVIGFIMGLVYTAFDICNWVMAGIKDTMLFINEIIICLQSIGRILMLPAFIKASKFTTQVAAVVLDMLACTTGIIKFSVNIQKLQMLDIQ